MDRPTGSPPWWFTPLRCVFIISSFSFVFLSLNDTIIAPNFAEKFFSVALETFSRTTQDNFLEDLTSITDTFEPLYQPPDTAAFRGPYSLFYYYFLNPRYIDPANLSRHSDTKVILMYLDGAEENTTIDGTIFEGCPESRCVITQSKQLLRHSTAVIIAANNAVGHTTTHPELQRAFPEQMFIYWNGESPAHGLGAGWIFKSNFFNWTMSYRTDGDIPGHYTYAVKLEKEKRNFAYGKKGLVAWFASHCNVASGRDTYIKELQKYLPVNITIFGKCAKDPAMQTLCPREPFRANSCAARLMRAHKFYLAFENSNCGGYMTEKPINALEAETVPIVMGRGNYKKLLPPKSFINVADFNHPKDLAEYLLKLDQNDTLYNEFMAWRYNPKHIHTSGSYAAKNSGFCKLCQKIHKNYTSLMPRMHWRIDKWVTNEKGRCVAGFWILPDGTNLYGNARNVTDLEDLE